MSKIAAIEVSALIHTIRDERVILDADLALMYGVTTRRLNEAVSRNLDRFPPDFRFQLTMTEWQVLKSQIATSKSGSGGKQKLPWVFTEHGAIMAANLLRSERAIQMSVFVVRAFIRMRNLFSDTSALSSKLDELEREVTARLDSHEQSIVELMRQFLSIINPGIDSELEEPSSKREIGFHVKDTAERKGAKSKRAR
jgi:hypothetical protein